MSAPTVLSTNDNGDLTLTNEINGTKIDSGTLVIPGDLIIVGSIYKAVKFDIGPKKQDAKLLLSDNGFIENDHYFIVNNFLVCKDRYKEDIAGIVFELLL